jgi:hypothetical protein
MLPAKEEDKAIQVAAKAAPDAPLLTDEQWEEIQPQLIRGNSLGSGQKLKATRDYLNKGESDA